MIVQGFKDIENRPWSTKFRGRIYVHAGGKVDWDGFEDLSRSHATYHTFSDWIRRRIPVEACDQWWAEDMRKVISRGLGAIVGEVDIVDCVTQSDSPWFTGPYGLVLRYPVAYDEPIPMKGKLGLFEVEVP